jgi:hypothetical protein
MRERAIDKKQRPVSCGVEPATSEPALPDLKRGGTDMGDTGRKDKGKREQQKQAQLTLKEKRKQKQDKKSKTL